MDTFRKTVHNFDRNTISLCTLKCTIPVMAILSTFVSKYDFIWITDIL